MVLNGNDKCLHERRARSNTGKYDHEHPGTTNEKAAIGQCCPPCTIFDVIRSLRRLWAIGDEAQESCGPKSANHRRSSSDRLSYGTWAPVI
ncbi:hypothetical protein GCM10009813_24660 [Brevibacterium marinum]